MEGGAINTDLIEENNKIVSSKRMSYTVQYKLDALKLLFENNDNKSLTLEILYFIFSSPKPTCR